MRLAACKTLARTEEPSKGSFSLLSKHRRAETASRRLFSAPENHMTVMPFGEALAIERESTCTAAGHRIAHSAARDAARSISRVLRHQTPSCTSNTAARLSQATRRRRARTTWPCCGEATAVLCSGTRLKSKRQRRAARLQRPMPLPSPEMTSLTTGPQPRATRPLAFYG